MIYLIDRGFIIKSALNILVNQCKYPGIYNECFCLSCSKDNDEVNDNDKDNDNDNVNDNVIDNDNFNDNVNDNVNDNDYVNDNDNFNVKDNVNDNANDNDNVKDNDIVNDIDNDEIVYLRSSYNQRSSPNLRISYNSRSGFNDQGNISPPRNNIIQTNPIAININNDLYSWLNDDDIITETAFPDNIRCIISGPSECGKTFLLKKLILASIYFIYFDKLYIIGPTGDQYHGIERINAKADVEFIKDIKDLPTPDKLPKDLKKLMIFDDVRAK